MKLILTGLIENITTRVDNSIKVSFGTQEITDSNAGKLFAFRNKPVKLLLSDSNIEEAEIKVVEDTGLKNNNKSHTPSQRLRFAIRKYHLAGGEKEDAIESLYEKEMSKIIMLYENKTYELQEQK